MVYSPWSLIVAVLVILLILLLLGVI